MPLLFDDPIEMAADMKRISEEKETQRLVNMRLPSKGESIAEICRKGRKSADGDTTLSRLIL